MKTRDKVFIALAREWHRQLDDALNAAKFDLLADSPPRLIRQWKNPPFFPFLSRTPTENDPSDQWDLVEDLNYIPAPLSELKCVIDRIYDQINAIEG